MSKNEILKLAQNYMYNKGIDIVLPGEISEIDGDKVEVIFLDPLTLEPDVIVCPPDNRVLVDVKTKEVSLVYQM